MGSCATQSYPQHTLPPLLSAPGIHEAVELRDGDKSKYRGKGVSKAVANVNTLIAPRLAGMDVRQQRAVDEAMCALDGTSNKGKLGANAILAVSLAVAKAGAAAAGIPLYRHFAALAGKSKLVLPTPVFNVINGGKHAGNSLAFQELMIMPVGAPTFSEAMRAGCEVYHVLNGLLKKKYGMDATNVGDEGGFAPNIGSAEEGLDLLVEAIKTAGYEGKVKIAMDVAASEFYVEGSASVGGKYDLGFKSSPGGKGVISSQDMLAMYQRMAAKYPIVSIEE